MLTWLLYVAFTTGHIYANVKAVSVLTFDTLNTNRANIIMNTYMATGKMVSPAEAAKIEPIFNCTPRISYKVHHYLNFL